MRLQLLSQWCSNWFACQSRSQGNHHGIGPLQKVAHFRMMKFCLCLGCMTKCSSSAAMAQGSAICALAQSRRVSCQCRLVCKRRDSTYVKILLFSLTIIFSLYCASSFDVLTSSGEICFGLWYHFHSYLGCFHQLCSRLAS